MTQKPGLCTLEYWIAIYLKCNAGGAYVAMVKALFQYEKSFFEEFSDHHVRSRRKDK
jgi:hypothetical protein